MLTPLAVLACLAAATVAGQAKTTPPAAAIAPSQAKPDLPLLEDEEEANPFSPDKPNAPAVVDKTDKTLNDLFSKLAAAGSVVEAHPYEQRILKRLIQTDSDTVNLMMGWTIAAMTKQRYGEALDLLDQILILKPDYAEAYNKRATVYFLLDDYGHSVADIEHALALEPRHFGALSGLAGILQRIGEDKEAYEVYQKLLQIHPNLPNARSAMEKLAPEVAGRDI
ncbi:putative PEP-CTERM system TPR-repeat lipoprotein [Hartmannibacter diazotrophicus]|uniref:Putative PEP-CTERM system TPR-repeat lipoprotein n=1 Tax=Hartmannibacter diazotrophicus TaxID=1482074 RepID=A0A2C9DBY2_9HYPH|nr:tetratricopeptide repeat protein [Hartmannibacter diazotrophicus]SON57231.1 putative PEP-CTERM system TPR-repeat lipoprotein [Hartmannibacter diazotrophicus]